MKILIHHSAQWLCLMLNHVIGIAPKMHADELKSPVSSSSTKTNIA